MKKIILMRHSIPDKSIKYLNCEMPLSSEGILKAERFFKRSEFKYVKGVYASTYKRAKQTAKIFTHDIITDDRIIERKIGNLKSNSKSFWKKQYDDYNYKNQDGESLNEVCLRMDLFFKEVLQKMDDGQTVLVVSHATAICAYLTKYCEITVIDEKEKTRKIKHNNKVVLNGKIDTPSMFVLSFDKDKLVYVEYKD